MVERLDEPTLLAQLNTLLTVLALPFTLSSPLELTPSLILALFESLLRTRLPLQPETRKSPSPAARVAAMKCVLGVLADDVLGADFAHVGIDAVDPRRLAAGRTREVKYVGEVLCWLARRMGYLNVDGSAAMVARRKGKEREAANGKLNLNVGMETALKRTPSPHSVASTGHGSSLLMHSTRSIDDSQTTISAAPDISQSVGDSFRDLNASASMDGSDSDDTVPGPSSSRWRGTGRNNIRGPSHSPHGVSNSRRRRHTIATVNEDYHDDDTDENEFSTEVEDGPSICHCPAELSLEAPAVKPIIRESGYLEEKSIDEELEEFHRSTSLRKSSSRNDGVELRRSSSSRTKHYGPVSSSPSPRTPKRMLNSSMANRSVSSPLTGIITKHTSPSQHTLALLEERARLLSELSKLRLDWDIE